jgi:hypothetical protein
LNPHR